MNEQESELLWGLLPHPSPRHVIRVFARDSRRLVGDFVRNERELRRFTNSTRGLSTYLAGNPTTSRSGVRHTAADVTHWSFFFVDIDPVEEEYYPNEALEVVLQHIGAYSGHNLLENKPTIIDSGRGVQLWLRTDDRELDENGDRPFEGPVSRQIARRTMSYWLKKIANRVGSVGGCKIDTSCSDLPRVMRMPYTINQKTGREGSIIHIQERAYPWLIPFLIAGTPKEVLYQPETTVVVAGKSWQEVFPRLTKSAQEYLMYGKEEPGRHQVVWHVARSLSEHGVSRDQAAKAIYRANKLRGPDSELSNGEVEHCLDTAYGTVNRGNAALYLENA